MSFSDWLIIGGTALLIRNGMKKEAANREEAEEEYNRYMSELAERESEWDRSKAVNMKRLGMPCFFKDGLSFQTFDEMAKRAGKKIKRIKDVSVYDALIYCTVESQSGYSDWNFSIDFNNWGHVTGTYWTKTDNDESLIPHHYGQMMSGWIHNYLRERGIVLQDLSDIVDQNKNLETDKGLNYNDNPVKKYFGSSNRSIQVAYGSDCVLGEHLYPVLSLLRHSGFDNIKTFSVADITDKTSGYYYQVEQVVINGCGYFESGTTFPENAEIYITYHEKQNIRMPFSESELRKYNYNNVGNKLQELGFSKIYERKIEDLITGWKIKNGYVESVLLDGDEKRHIEKNALYDYDQKLVICYHTKKEH